MSKVLLHTVHTRFYSAPEESRLKILARFQQLAEQCGGKEAGILFWNVEQEQYDTRKTDMVQIGIFRDEEAFEAFRKHPIHKKLKLELRECADWNPGNFFPDKDKAKEMVRALLGH